MLSDEWETNARNSWASHLTEMKRGGEWQTVQVPKRYSGEASWKQQITSAFLCDERLDRATDHYWYNHDHHDERL